MKTPSKPLSFEFFPPRSDAQVRNFEGAWKALEKTEPEYFSVTFGAGGSDQEATFDTVAALQSRSAVSIAPHLSCMVPSQDVLRNILERYSEIGVRRLVVLRGDRPEEASQPPAFEHANELVAFVRDVSGDQFRIEVGCYPELHSESESPASELKYFRQKVDAGADGAITQYFYNPDAYFRFVEECTKVGIVIPIRPGLLPITNYHQLMRFSNMCGAEVPRWIARRLESYGDDLASIQAFGLDVVSDLAERLLRGGAPGLHVYSLNKPGPALGLLDRLSHG